VTADDRLAVYRAKRDFARTPEPSGAATPPEPGQRFVVQRHRARRLHYDLRLEVDGVLASWAVPKGPTLDPTQRRMAVQVEDHPLEYFGFEGVIPRGEYGGGDVIVWDWGTWSREPKDGGDLAAAIEAGEVHVDLHGEKLEGRFVLVRDHRRDATNEWLLLHKRDDFAVPGWNVEDHDRSVKSGRTNDEVRADPDFEWHSDAPLASAEVSLRQVWDAPTADEIDALAALGRSGTWTFQGREVRVTNLDEEVCAGRDGEPAVTKREVLAYHAAVAPLMLPYLTGRTSTVDAHDVVIDDPPALVAVVNDRDAVEIHTSAANVDAPDRPTWVTIAIDPGARMSRDDVALVASLHRTALEHLGVLAAPKLSGHRSVEIWIPVAPRYTFEQTSAWVERVSQLIRANVADLDYREDARDTTAVAPFGIRPAPGAPVSVPIAWDELDDAELRADRWTIRTVLDRLADTGDPLRELIGLEQVLPTL
jgi:bifunctional non-homologous end joining protein LigD